MEFKGALSELKMARAQTHREIAIAEYEKNLKLLAPWLEQSAAILDLNLENYHAGTCEWVLKLTEFSHGSNQIKIRYFVSLAKRAVGNLYSLHSFITI